MSRSALYTERTSFENILLSSDWSQYGIGLSEESEIILDGLHGLRTHYLFPVSRFSEDSYMKFYSLASAWRSETGMHSLMIHKAMHPSYQIIIGMGVEALPYIFNEMRSSQDHWFWALRAITSLDPVLPEHRGNIEEMTNDWLNWARKQGYEF